MCSLDEAYSFFTEPKSKKKRKQALLPPPESWITSPGNDPTVDPDRPAHRRLPPAELLGGPVTENETSTSISQMLQATESSPSSDYFPHPTSDVKDDNVYSLTTDWATMFTDSSAPSWIKERMPVRAAEAPLIPSAWVDGQSTLWQNVSPGYSPSGQRQFDITGAERKAEDRLDELQKKLDNLFKKLEDEEQRKTQTNHLEIIMFVLGGFFLLLLLDMLVKQGTHATMLLANAANNGPISMINGVYPV
jgi:hypothetical protein